MNIQKQKYKYRKYDKSYPELFRKEKIKLGKTLKNTIIEHVGSTSIKGLGGKGIIDIAIRTPRNKITEYINKLKKLEYKQAYNHKRTHKNIFLQRIIKYKGKERRIHIHLALTDRHFDTFILVRDYLKKHRDASKRYAEIKKEGVLYAKGEGEKYREYKKEFLEKLQKKAFKEMRK